MVLNYQMNRLDGSPEDLGKYRGNVILLVNVASRCGLTPQYTALQQLYERYHGQGFEILGFPANDFMGQEPGTDEEIAQFCEMNYGVTFPVFSKISVKGDAIHPLYAELTSLPEPLGGDVQWNFQKYLVDRNGEVAAKFGPRTTPDSDEVVTEIERLINA
jgi:glutathione peroxidase